VSLPPETSAIEITTTATDSDICRRLDRGPDARVQAEIALGSHRLLARNRNFARAGDSRTALIVASGFGVLTPLRGSRGTRLVGVMTAGMALSLIAARGGVFSTKRVIRQRTPQAALVVRFSLR
jgi:hypothetical protein